MNLIAKDLEALNYLSGNNSVLDAVVSKFEFFLEDAVLKINIHLQLSRRTKTQSNLVLTFTDVVEYGFYHNSKHIFYNVEDLKFFEKEGLYYFSSDPYHAEGISENDNDFILSNGLECYAVENASTAS